MAKKGSNKSSAVKSTQVSKSKVRSSLECEKCTQQCAEGIRYMDSLKIAGSQGKGVHCKL